MHLPRTRWRFRLNTVMLAVAILAVGLGMSRPIRSLGDYLGIVTTVSALLAFSRLRQWKRDGHTVTSGTIVSAIMLSWIGIAILVWVYARPMHQSGSALDPPWAFGPG